MLRVIFEELCTPTHMLSVVFMLRTGRRILRWLIGLCVLAYCAG